MSTPAKKPAPPTGYFKYIFGGTAGMGATIVVQPLDLVKTRLQLSGEGGGQKEYKNTFDALSKILRREGFGIYQGLGAALLRQATYTTTRLGVYTQLNDAYVDKFSKSPHLLASMGMGMAAGACGAAVGTPAEVSLIRMTADKMLPEAERRNYKGVGNALARITREEGLFALWKGCIPTVGRAMIVNMAQLASYTQIKKVFATSGYFEEGILLHFCASMCSGFITTAASLPMDIAKTRVQNQKPGADGKLPYKGTLDVMVKVSRHEGVLSLWKGFTPYFFRLGPHTVLTFILLEQMNVAYRNFYN